MLTHSSGEIISLGRDVRHQVDGHIVKACAPFYSVRDPSLWNGITYIPEIQIYYFLTQFKNRNKKEKEIMYANVLGTWQFTVTSSIHRDSSFTLLQWETGSPESLEP